MMPDQRDLRIFAEVGSVVDNKEFLESSFAEHSSVCLSLSGSVEEEEIGWSMPDSSDEDILLRKYARSSC